MHVKGRGRKRYSYWRRLYLPKTSDMTIDIRQNTAAAIQKISAKCLKTSAKHIQAQPSAMKGKARFLARLRSMVFLQFVHDSYIGVPIGREPECFLPTENTFTTIVVQLVTAFVALVIKFIA